MSYINSLIETYDEIFKNEGFQDIKMPRNVKRFSEIKMLLPLYHNTFKVKREIVINNDGDVINIEDILDEKKTRTTDGWTLHRKNIRENR